MLQTTRLRADALRLKGAIAYFAGDGEAAAAALLEAVTLVADGKTNKEVGAALFLSHKTVEFHPSRIY